MKGAVPSLVLDLVLDRVRRFKRTVGLSLYSAVDALVASEIGVPLQPKSQKNRCHSQSDRTHYSMSHF